MLAGPFPINISVVFQGFGKVFQIEFEFHVFTNSMSCFLNRFYAITFILKKDVCVYTGRVI